MTLFTSMPIDCGICGVGTLLCTRSRVLAFLDVKKRACLFFAHTHWYDWLAVELLCCGISHAICAEEYIVEICWHNAVNDLAVTMPMIIRYSVSFCCIAHRSSSLDVGVLSGWRKSPNAVKTRARYTIYLSFVSAVFDEQCRLTNVEGFLLSTLSFHTGALRMAIIDLDWSFGCQPCFSYKAHTSCRHGDSWYHSLGVPVWFVVFGAQNMISSCNRAQLFCATCAMCCTSYIQPCLWGCLLWVRYVCSRQSLRASSVSATDVRPYPALLLLILDQALFILPCLIASSHCMSF